MRLKISLFTGRQILTELLNNFWLMVNLKKQLCHGVRGWRFGAETTVIWHDFGHIRVGINNWKITGGGL